MIIIPKKCLLPLFYLELCVKLYTGQENRIKHLPGKYVASDLRLHFVNVLSMLLFGV